MSTSSNQKIAKDFKRALDEYVAANAVYISMLQLYTGPEPLSIRETTPPLKTHLDVNDLREFEEAWVRDQEASKKLRRTFMKLYSTYQ